MDQAQNKKSFSFLKIELRTLLAVLILLLILVGIGLAADSSSIVFDFGTGLSSEVAPGAISVAGGNSVYPKANGAINYGWKTPYIAEQSSGSAVDDLLRTDSNQGVGENTFIISGLSSEYYQITMTSGNLSSSIATKVVVDNYTYIAQSSTNNWRTITFKVKTNAGRIDLLFQKYTTDVWAINSLSIAPTSAPVASPTFSVTLQPEQLIINQGETDVMQISVVPENGYSNDVNLSISNLPNGAQFSFQPASGIPPFIAYLTVTLSVNLPATQYNLNLSATGSDPVHQIVNKKINMLVNSNQPGVSVGPELGSREYSSQSRNQQNFIDRYLSAESRFLPRQTDMMALEELPYFANSLGSVPEPPQAKSFVDASLRYLTTAGIIGVVVDSAPVVSSSDEMKSIGFWGSLFGAMFNPVR